MARPFTYVSSQMYYDFEIYFFKLTLFTDSEEYAKMGAKKRNRIDAEIMRIDSLLQVMLMFRQIPKDEVAILGWKKHLDHEDECRRVFRFSSPIVASKCLDINPSHIVAVCKHKRPTAGGYVFEYAVDKTAGKPRYWWND